MAMIGLGQAPTMDVINRLRVITGVPGRPTGSGAIYYPSQNPEDYGPNWQIEEANPEAQAAALRWLAAEYPEEVVQDVEQGVDAAGNPVYRIVVRDRGGAPPPAGKECPKDTIIPCVPNWMLWVGVGLLVLMRR